MRFLSEKEQSVEKEALSFLDQCEEFLLAEYERENGNQLDTDRAKELFPQFATSEETRVRFASAVYRPASRLIDLLFERKLKARTDLSGPIVFLAGGPGVGKTTFAETIRETLNEAYLVMDGTLSDYERAVWFVESALEVGSEVLINFVHRDYAEAIHGVIDRALSPQSLRVVPMSVVAAKHAGARSTLHRLVERFSDCDEVAFQIAVYQGTGRPFKEGTLREVPLLKLDVLQEKAYEIVRDRFQKQSRQSGDSTFPEELYQRLRQ